MGNTLSLYEQTKPVNYELTITYTPSASVVKYTYEIYKNDKKEKEYTMTSNVPVDINLLETGTYQIIITELDKRGSTNQIKTGFYKIDLEQPIIQVDDVLTLEQLKKGETIDLSDYVHAYDTVDGDLSSRLSSNLEEIDLNQIGNHKLTYMVTDNAGNTTTKTVTLNIIESSNFKLQLFQGTIIAILCIILGIILIFKRAMEREKRISRFSVIAIRDNSYSVFDRFFNRYHKFLNRIVHVIEKLEVIKRHSKRYDKYAILSKNYLTSGMEFIAFKISIALIFLLIAVFSKTIQYQVLKIYEIMIPLLCGYFIPNILLISRYKLHHNRLENDLLQAIIIMNNAFKSGRSITQAIHLVTEELTGTIALEFKKMELEMNFGLSIDVVFKRLSERVDLEEIAYLTASLSVLNRTGGNIIKVFSSIEKSLFNKKKLKLELDSLTGSSRLIVYVLFVVPILFILFVSIINPTYFEPFYTTDLGFLFMGIILTIYIVYIWFVRKIMKVRM